MQKKLKNYLVCPPKIGNIQESITLSKIIVTRHLKKHFKA